MPNGLEQRDLCDQVVLEIAAWIADAPAVRRVAHEIKDHVHVEQRWWYRVHREVGSEERQAGAIGLEVGGMPATTWHQAVDHSDGPPKSCEPEREVAPDETGATQHGHPPIFPMARVGVRHRAGSGRASGTS